MTTTTAHDYAPEEIEENIKEAAAAAVVDFLSAKGLRGRMLEECSALDDLTTEQAEAVWHKSSKATTNRVGMFGRMLLDGERGDDLNSGGTLRPGECGPIDSDEADAILLGITKAELHTHRALVRQGIPGEEAIEIARHPRVRHNTARDIIEESKFERVDANTVRERGDDERLAFLREKLGMVMEATA